MKVKQSRVPLLPNAERVNPGKTVLAWVLGAVAPDVTSVVTWSSVGKRCSKTIRLGSAG